MAAEGVSQHKILVFGHFQILIKCFTFVLQCRMMHAVAWILKALFYKPGGREFSCRRGHLQIADPQNKTANFRQQHSDRK
jgi:hypothetical protein